MNNAIVAKSMPEKQSRAFFGGNVHVPAARAARDATREQADQQEGGHWN